MNIFISANERYVYPAKVMLTSFLINNPPPEDNFIHFIYNDVQPQSLAELESLVHQYGANFIPHYVDRSLFSQFSTSQIFPVEVYFRLLIPQFLPPEEERALWLDVDLIVNGSIHDFYYQDFEGTPMIVCRDKQYRKDWLAAMGCPEDAVYFNSGVLLFNLDLMRKYTLEDYFAAYNAQKESIVYFDQEVLNYIFAGHVKLADQLLFNNPIEYDHQITQDDLDKFMNNSLIVHFLGPIKPWHSKFASKCGRLWDKYHVLVIPEHAGYLFRRNVHRWMQRHIWLPFRIFRDGLYKKLPFILQIVKKLKQK